MSKAKKTPEEELKTFIFVFGDKQIVVDAETVEDAQRLIEIEMKKLDDPKLETTI